MKVILLDQGMHALVSDEDYPNLIVHKWHVKKFKQFCYAGRTVNFYLPDGRRTCKTILMHREILGITSRNIYGDHINHQTLDNRRSNLRTCTHTENMRNRITSKKSLSGFTGVTWNKQQNKWVAIIGVDGKNIFLGYHDDKNVAALRYNEAAKKHFGSFANLNVIPNSNSLTAQTTAI